MDKSSTEETGEVRSSTPSKITDYFPASPKPQADKKLKNDNENVSPDTSGLTEEILESSVLLTPEASPAKEKEERSNRSDTDSHSSTDVPCCKQAILENGPSKKSSKTKSSKLKSQPEASTATETGKNKRGKSAKTKSKTKATEPQLNNSLVTDYFPVRRSYRKCKTDIEKEKQIDLEDKVLNKKEEGLKVEVIDNKGRGVIATKAFYRGDFVIEYAGDLIDLTTAKEKEQQYSENPETGCYMYYFTHKNKNYCVDATAESGRLGRLINHSRTAANCQTKLIDIKDQPYLILTASRDIKIGEELLYDYGDRSKTSIESHPWLKK